ncbi:MAG: hypothetical protein COB45_04310 [Gammaproteobacteria bacterium]|nr:MAG: hypothetical protein COB45_04310 [Gammaproteobacteria bacterium]
MRLLNKFSAICFLLMFLGSIIMGYGFITDKIKFYKLMLWLTVNVLWIYPIEFSHKEIIKKEKLEQRKKSVWWNC